MKYLYLLAELEERKPLAPILQDAVLGPGLAVIVDPGGRDIGVTELLLDLGDVALEQVNVDTTARG